jgi:hypothetical protein
MRTVVVLGPRGTAADPLRRSADDQRDLVETIERKGAGAVMPD